MKKKAKKIISCISAVLALYFIVCGCLYFFEPVEYNSDDLSKYQYYFDLYNKYDQSKNSEFFIKQISCNDISTSEIDKRIKYVNNTVIAIADNSCNYSEITSLLNNYNGKICGYIKKANFYQITFYEYKTYYQLLELCDKMISSGYFLSAIPDYFEETPVSEYSTNEDYPTAEYYDLLNIYEVLELSDNTLSSVNIGMIDYFVYDNNLINIANNDEYDNEQLKDIFADSSSASHGTHVAGIMGAKYNSKIIGVSKNAKIYSYNGINVSTSYWIANICDMIINKNIKTINISMAYNSYITLSASLGGENTIDYIDNEQLLFTNILSNLISDGYEFVICTAAGNSGNDSLYRIYNLYFEYGNKKYLSKIDIFGIFDVKPKFVDSKYTFFISDSTDKNVRNRIIVVGAVDSNGNYLSYSNSGENVDIAATGKYIYSTSFNNGFEYKSGTSMATPFVSGTVGLLFSIFPDLSGAEIKNIIINSAEKSASHNGFESPILNIGNAIKNIKNQ